MWHGATAPLWIPGAKSQPRQSTDLTSSTPTLVGAYAETLLIDLNPITIVAAAPSSRRRRSMIAASWAALTPRTPLPPARAWAPDARMLLPLSDAADFALVDEVRQSIPIDSQKRADCYKLNATESFIAPAVSSS